MNDLMMSESNVEFSPDELQYRIWVIPDYEGGKTSIIWKINHVIGDGFGIMVAFADLDDDYHNKTFIQTQTIPKWMRGLLFIMKPFTALFSAI